MSFPTDMRASAISRKENEVSLEPGPPLLDSNRLANETRTWVSYANATATVDLQEEARILRDLSFGNTLTYSPNIFIPLTQLCRDTCGYCTFAKRPRQLGRVYMTLSEVEAIVRAGERFGCREVLFTLGDKPELRYHSAADELDVMGYSSTFEYLTDIARHVSEESTMLPHINAGVLTEEQFTVLREFSGSQGLMLETLSERLSQKGGPHFGSPDKVPSVRLAAIAAAGRAKVPFTTGILVGIGETEVERIEALVAIGMLHRQFGHIQEVIVQNFEPKAGTRMSLAPRPCEEEYLRAIALARLVLPTDISIQAPPNLNRMRTRKLIASGVDDFGGVSPTTLDHVNPEAPWPRIDTLNADATLEGYVLKARHCVGPRFIRDGEAWLSPPMRRKIMAQSDSRWLVRDDAWEPGRTAPPMLNLHNAVSPNIENIVRRAEQHDHLRSVDIVDLFHAPDGSLEAIFETANTMREGVVGNDVTYVVNRNINYTNICSYKCTFCAFSKGKTSESLRGKPYIFSLDEIVKRAAEAVERGATEVCLQGGIHPDFSGNTYLDICVAIKTAFPALHIHAFSPLEVSHGAATLGLSVSEFLVRLKNAGLGSLPGTAAEILDDAVREIICPDKLSAGAWLDVVRCAHSVGLPTTSTIMFGHIEEASHWAHHLLCLRKLQEETGGITEFVPLPFVAAETPMYLKGASRRGPTFKEAMLMHAVARMVLGPVIPNIQTSWVKMTPTGAAAALNAGANDLGGVLMNESITKAAGAKTGEEFTVDAMRGLAQTIDRPLVQRNTLYIK